MAYFDGQAQPWSQHRRPDSWSQSGPPSSAGGSTQGVQLQSPPPSTGEESQAFSSQFEEITRASDNLTKSIKMFGMHGRRDSMPNTGPFARQYPDFDSRAYPGPSRHHSVSDYDAMRSPSAHSSSSVQGYLAHQRFGSRPSEADQMMQAKRRAAALRERELRNYHQEQQFNRSSTGPKSDRSMSPASMNEDDRRELIARQHRALYGEGANLYMGGGGGGEASGPPRQSNQDGRGPTSSASSTHGQPSSGQYEGSYQGPSNPSGADGASNTVGAGGNQQSRPRSRTNSTASKSPNPNSFPIFDSAQQANRTSASSPGGSPTRSGTQGPNVGPIGSRPNQGGNQGSRKTPPMPSSLGYGFNSGNEKSGLNNTPGGNVNSVTERSSSAASNPTTSGPEKSHLGWNTQTGPWGSGKNLSVQASVWG